MPKYVSAELSPVARYGTKLDVSEKYRLSEREIYRLLNAGLIKAKKHGNPHTDPLAVGRGSPRVAAGLPAQNCRRVTLCHHHAGHYAQAVQPLRLPESVAVQGWRTALHPMPL
jgi:hypothetical protein